MPPPNDSRLPSGVQIRRLPGGDLDISTALADLLVTSRNKYDWPAGTGARESQNVIIELKREVESLLRGLILQGAIRLSKWYPHGVETTRTRSGELKELPQKNGCARGMQSGTS